MMGKPRACDVCSLRKIKCDGDQPCSPCSKAKFDCSYAKRPLKPGPKGPRATTSNRIRSRLQDIRAQAGEPARSEPSTAASSPPRSPNGDTPPFSVRPPLPSFPSAGPSRITFEDVCEYLRIYHQRMYAVWPVVDVEDVIARLGPGMQDVGTCALAFAVCAATGAQLRLDDTDAPHTKARQILIDTFAYEAERCRAMIDSRENATINSILIPFFLMMYYSSRKKRITSTLLLREALTLCEMLDLDKESAYANFDTEDQKYRRKVFWLLFVTERGHAMQHEMATVLRNTISMPSPEDDKHPETFVGFLKLVNLFVAVDGTLIGGGPGEDDPHSSKEWFTNLQQQLQNDPEMPANGNEVQRTDITVTQHWMRMLVWKLSMKKVKMTAGSANDPLSLTFPAHIAQDSLAFLSNVSLDSVIAHGPGMELKIFEIADTLLDVINCVPSLTNSNSSLMRHGPHHIFHGLSQLLASLNRGHSRPVALLQSKMAENQVSFMSIPRFVEIHDESASSDRSRSSTRSPISPIFPVGTTDSRTLPSIQHGLPPTPSSEAYAGSWPNQNLAPMMPYPIPSAPRSTAAPTTSMPNLPMSAPPALVFNNGWPQQASNAMKNELDGFGLNSRMDIDASSSNQHLLLQMPNLGLANEISSEWHPPPYSPV